MSSDPVRTRRQLIDTLKRDGPQDAARLSSTLGVTAMAVRQHLYEFERQKLVTFENERVPVGRPRKLWRLTAEADRCFPDAHADLTVGLIDSIRQAFGANGMDKLLAVRKQNAIQHYRDRMPAQGNLRARVEALAAARSAEGYMAEVKPLKRGEFLLVENHCPICVAAAACQGLCSVELETFREVLGDGVTIERTEHIQAGARRCAYRVCGREDRREMRREDAKAAK